MKVFLSGPMGAGKSTLGPRVAARFGLPFVDLDALVEERTGVGVAQLFAAKGEREFRRIEEATARELLTSESPCVVALGGGTITSAALRRALLAHGVLITLDADPAVLVRRANDGTRPLLEGDPDARLRELLGERAAAYAECHARIDTSGAPDAAVTEIERVVREAPIPVPLGLETYHVRVGAGLRARVPEIALALRPSRCLVVTDDHVRARYAGPIAKGLSAGVVSLPPGEPHKTLATVDAIWTAALAAGLDRSAMLVAVGGGVVGDLAGFAASTLLRGVAFAQVPTTLLAMVDSSVGGKTGFDRTEGKNLIGTFHQPSFVVCDVETLATLPRSERISGLAEVVKSAWLDSEHFVLAIEKDAQALVAGDPAATERAVRASIALKSKIVAADEREGGLRATLNLGHTIGHALEVAGGYGALRHGEAVSLGLIAAFRVAVALGRTSAEHAARIEALLDRLDLPVDLDGHLDARALAFVAADKKRAGDRVRFVVPGAPGETSLVPLTIPELEKALASP